MKRTILFLLFAVLSVANIHAQETKNITYIVDGTKVENFDGSQLVGKTIVNYTINEEGDVHAIFTSAYEAESGKIGKVTILSGKGMAYTTEKENAEDTEMRVRAEKPEDILCVVDGKIVSQTELQNMSPSQIDSMTVIKDKTFPDYIKYSTEAGQAPNAVIIIKTK